MDLSSWAAGHLRLVAVVVVVAQPSVALAQASADQPTAEALFTDGRRLLAQGKYAEACPKFAESQRLDPGIGTLLNLADCYEKSGRTASAWATFREASEAAHRAADTTREKVAIKRGAALEERLAKLTITVPAQAVTPGLQVKRDDVSLGRAVWGTAAPVDPGPHVIEATAPGKKPWSTTITVDATRRALSVSIPALEDAPPEPVAAAPVAQAAAPPAADKGAPSGAGQKVAAIVVASTGAAAFGVGALFGVMASAKKDESDLACHQNICSKRGVDLRAQALTNATVSTVAFSVGAAALVGGAALWFTAPSSNKDASVRVRAVPYAGPGSVGATVLGVF